MWTPLQHPQRSQAPVLSCWPLPHTQTHPAHDVTSDFTLPRSFCWPWLGWQCSRALPAKPWLNTSPARSAAPSCTVSRQGARTTRIYSSPDPADSRAKPELNCTISELFTALPPLLQAAILPDSSHGDGGWTSPALLIDHPGAETTTSLLPTTSLLFLGWDSAMGDSMRSVTSRFTDAFQKKKKKSNN